MTLHRHRQVLRQVLSMIGNRSSVKDADNGLHVGMSCESWHSQSEKIGRDPNANTLNLEQTHAFESSQITKLLGQLGGFRGPQKYCLREVRQERVREHWPY